jgi:2-methylcitrate dehydratase PrpD
MSNADKIGATEELLENVLSTRFEDLDTVLVDTAKNRIIDLLGCVVGAANAPGIPPLVGLIKEWGGKPEASILAHGIKVPAPHAAMVNAIMARSYDFEPLQSFVEGRAIKGYISGTTIPTALAMGEVKGISGKELITSLLVGDNVASRIQATSGVDFMSIGWTSIGTANMFGATAIAGRILGLNRLQMRNAFGITLNQINSSSLQNEWDGAITFKIHQGTSARGGIFSSELARAGWTGPDDALFGQFAYFNLHGGCKHPEFLTKDLGKKYYADGSFKPYSCCAGTHPAIDCALALLAKHDIDVENIDNVTLYVHRGGFLDKPFKIGGLPHAEAIYSHYYTLATALLHGSVRPEHFSEKAMRDPRVAELIGKITLEEPAEANRLSGSEVKITMDDGSLLAGYIRPYLCLMRGCLIMPPQFPKSGPFKIPASNLDGGAAFGYPVVCALLRNPSVLS